MSTDANPTTLLDATAVRVAARARQIFMGLRDKDLSGSDKVLVLLSRQVALLEETAAAVEMFHRDWANTP